MEWRLEWTLFLLLALTLLQTESKPDRTRRLRQPALRRRAQTQTSSSSDLQSDGTSPAATSTSKDKDYKVVCYYTNWSQYRPKIGKFLPEDIPADLCTHLIFAFGWLKKGKLSSFETNDETKDGKIGLYDRINALKKVNPKLKTLLAIGGWSFGTQKFKDLSATRYTRQTFIFSAIAYVRERGFDGLDLDWEYPKGSEDKVNFVALLKELKEAFAAEAEETGSPQLLLSAAVPVGPDSIRGGYDVPAVNKYLDFINLMAYDFHGKWESQTGHNAPLHAPSSDSAWRKQLSVTNAAETWVQLGAERKKLVIGMPTYGRSFTLSDVNNATVNVATKGGGVAGTYTKEGGFLAYYEICELLLSGQSSYTFDEEMQVPYLVNGDQWVGFDDERSIRIKMKWLKEKGFGGAMVWTVDMDDFGGGVCTKGGEKRRYPLITVMKEELLNAQRGFKDTDWSAVAQPKKKKAKPAPQPIPLKEVLKRRSTTEAPQEEDNEEEEEDTKSRAPFTVCRMSSKASSRQSNGKFLIENVDAKLCTHVVYAHVGVKGSQMVVSNDVVEKLVKLREANGEVKILLALGPTAALFENLTSNIFRRNNFVYNALEFLREKNVDGIVIDWPTPEDPDSHAEFIKEIRMAFEGEAKGGNGVRLILGVQVGEAESYISAELSKYVDFFSLSTFSYAKASSSVVGHNSPLFGISEADPSVAKTLADWVAAGAPREKLLVGLPTFGRTFTLKSKEKYDIGSEVKGPGEKGEWTKEAGLLAYYEVCSMLHSDNTTLVWDSEQSVPFAYNELQWAGFDDERSFKAKIDFLKGENLGGVGIESLDMDDFSGSSCTGSRYPLLKTVVAELEGYRVPLVYDGPLEESVVASKKGSADLTCAEADGHISYHKDPTDCTKYFMCEGERKHHMPCPAQLVFNINENVCDWPENVEGCGKEAAAAAAAATAE